MIGRLAWMADRLLGEPPDPHPVALLGRWISFVEERVYAPRRRNGAVLVVATVVPVAAVSAAVSTLGGAFGAVAVVWTCLAGRSLDEHARKLAALLESGDVDAARALAPALVGRDPSALDDKELTRAGVESVAESTVDAVAGPLFWAAVAGPVGAAVFRAVNTLDSMVGYRDEHYRRFGWAAARLDDVLAWVPARLVAGTVGLLAPDRPVLAVVARDAGGHPSPNAGVAEAAFAAALGVSLGGRNMYAGRVEERPALGDGPPPTAGDVLRACDLARRVGDLLAWVIG